MTVALPSWTARGMLPPINPSSPDSTDRSPYLVALTDVIIRFSTSSVRHTILTGFIDFRNALHRVGLVQGFQWLNGSFLENVEVTEDRSPRDIDVVTFFRLPIGQTQTSLIQHNRALFDPRETKMNYHVDAYFVQLDADMPEQLVAHSVYWYSMWSHRRSGEWKGYLRIDLSPVDDQTTRVNLSNPEWRRGQP